MQYAKKLLSIPLLPVCGRTSQQLCPAGLQPTLLCFTHVVAQEPKSLPYREYLRGREVYNVRTCSSQEDKPPVRWTSRRAMAQAVSRRPPTVEATVQSRISPCGICGGQSSSVTGFSPQYFGFPLSISFHRCSITRKNEKKIIFITGLHNKPQGCGASVASAAGLFTTRKK
jgi:hypothetical protein